MKPAIRMVALAVLGLAMSMGAARAQQSKTVFNVCPGTYALCTTAVCERTAKPDVLECMCTVNQGYSVGIGTQAQCPAQGGATIPSRYFPMTAYQTCNAKPTSEHPWADCLDAPCAVDPNNKTIARCGCHTVDKEMYKDAPSYPWLVVTGQVKTNLCTTGTIYSSATTAAAQAVTNAFNAYNQATPPAQLSIPTALQR
jgi:hypothetical protein